MISFLFNAVIVLCAILFAYFSWRKIELGIMAIVFCLPLYLIRFSIFGIPSTVLELGIYILFIIWFAKNHYHINLRKIISDKTLQAGIIFLLAGAIISTVFSSDLKTSAGILKGWFFDPFLLFVILVSEIKTLKQRENILKAFYFSGLAVALASLIYLIIPELNGVSYDGRLHSFYLSPNYLAMYLSPALLIGIWMIFLSLRGGQQGGEAIPLASSKKRDCFACLLTGLAMTNKYFLSVSILIIAAALYFTYSYAAWLAIAVSCFFLIYLIISPAKRKMLFGSILLVFAILFFSQSGTSKFENLKNLSYRSSYNSRLMIWRSAREIGKDNFIIGIGPGNFQKYYLEYQSRALGIEPYLEWAVPQPHNIFLAFWLETGILGLLGFLLLLAWFFKRSLNLLILSLLAPLDNLYQIFINKTYYYLTGRGVSVSRRSDEAIYVRELRLSRPEYRARNDKKDNCLREYYLLVAVLLSIMVYILIHGLFDTTYWKNDLAIIFWLLLALLVSIKSSCNKK